MLFDSMYRAIRTLADKPINIYTGNINSGESLGIMSDARLNP